MLSPLRASQQRKVWICKKLQPRGDPCLGRAAATTSKAARPWRDVGCRSFLQDPDAFGFAVSFGGEAAILKHVFGFQKILKSPKI